MFRCSCIYTDAITFELEMMNAFFRGTKFINSITLSCDSNLLLERLSSLHAGDLYTFFL